MRRFGLFVLFAFIAFVVLAVVDLILSLVAGYVVIPIWVVLLTTFAVGLFNAMRPDPNADPADARRLKRTRGFILVILLMGAIAGLIGRNAAPVFNAAARGLPPEPTVPAAVNPTAVPSDYSGSTWDGVSCPTTGQAKVITGVDVQRLATEACAFVWRAVPKAGMTANCPEGLICTVTHPDETVKVYLGSAALRLDMVAATFRVLVGYPRSDAVWTPCALLAKEQEFGRVEDPSFTVTAGNFTCVGQVDTKPSAAAAPPVNSGSSAGSGEAVSTGCPVFGNETVSYQTTPLPDGGCNLKTPGYVLITAKVPDGWRAHYWTGSEVKDAQSGETITTAEASFYQNGK